MELMFGNDDYHVSSFIKLGAKLGGVLIDKSLTSLSCNMSDRDIIIIIGGSNDVGRFSPYQLSLLKACKSLKGELDKIRPRILFLNIFKSCDINLKEEIKIANSIIKENLQIYSKVRRKLTFVGLNEMFERQEFTQHGLRLGRNGKAKLVARLKEIIVSTMLKPVYEVPSEGEIFHNGSSYLVIDKIPSNEDFH